jgi:hypothetical protein
MGVQAPQHENGDAGLDEITSMIGNVDLTGKFRENPLDRRRQMGGKSATKGDYTNSKAQTPTRPTISYLAFTVPYSASISNGPWRACTTRWTPQRARLVKSERA